MKIKQILLITLFFATLITSLLQQNIYILDLFAISTFFMLPFNKWWNRGTIALLLFSVFYAIMIILGGHMNSVFMTISYLIAPVAFYRFGHFVLSVVHGDEKRFKFLSYVVLAYLIHLFILNFVDISIVGIVNEDRILLGMSQEEEAMSATLYGLMASVGIGCIATLFATDSKLLTKIIFLILVVSSMLVVVHLVNRGGLVVFAITLLLSIFIYHWRNKIKLVKTILFILVLAFSLFYFDVISNDVLMAYNQRHDIQGYETMTAGGRTELWELSIRNMLSHPLGWEQKSYAHNLWLDLARLGGWISLLPFLVASLITFKRISYTLRFRPSSFAKTLVVLNIALLMASSIEPIIEGSMLFFSLMMMFWGMIDKIASERS